MSAVSPGAPGSTHPIAGKPEQHAAEIIAAVREHGGRFAIDANGGHTLRRPKGFPVHLVRELRENARAVKIELGRSDQLRLEFAPESPAIVQPLDFWSRQDRRFDALLVEFGIPVDASTPPIRGAA